MKKIASAFYLNHEKRTGSTAGSRLNSWESERPRSFRARRGSPRDLYSRVALPRVVMRNFRWHSFNDWFDQAKRTFGSIVNDIREAETCARGVLDAIENHVNEHEVRPVEGGEEGA